MREASPNNFDILRLLFASLVIFSHSFALVGDPEPVAWGRTLGNLAVHGFFVVSGYLVAQSWLRAPSLGPYALKRTLRIAPGLIAALVLTTAAGLLTRNFAGNPLPGITNGPVWTLTWEVACYAILGLLGLIGLQSAIAAVFAAGWVVYLVNIGDTSDFALVVAPMMLMFAAGALFAVRMPRIPLVVVALAAAGMALTASYGAFVAVHSGVTTLIPFAYGPSGTAEQVFRASTW